MATKLFVGGLAYAINDSGLSDFFSKIGKVESAKVIADRFSGQSKGFGFVEMSTDEEAQKAIAELNGKDLEGRTVTVSVARPREENPARSFNDHSNDS
ncbi:MAG: RNA recognition motif domain-containing protein [Candidatus Saccharimonadales bacterium]